MTDQTLAVFSASLDRTGAELVANGRWPRKDYFELARELDAEIIDYSTIEERRAWRWMARLLGKPLAQAWIAFQRRGSYAAVFTDGEHIGIPLALLFSLVSCRPRHVTIGHLLSTRSKRLVFRWLRPQRAFARILVHGMSQFHFVSRTLQLNTGVLMPYQIDELFWKPAKSEDTKPLICSAGLEYRDYPTLLSAVSGLDMEVVIAAGSRWSTHADLIRGKKLPPNVTVLSLDYGELRALYARSMFVVVPLRDVDNPAGVTTILEAMAMGKAVIVTATAGQSDVVRGRNCTPFGPSGEPIGGPHNFGFEGDCLGDCTGLYVPPGDSSALRAAIEYLFDNPDEARQMGAAGRRLVEQHMTLDQFVMRVTKVVKGNLGTEPLFAGHIESSPIVVPCQE
jgi:glycosyltransferase involved in cell wall biosynthesis